MAARPWRALGVPDKQLGATLALASSRRPSTRRQALVPSVQDRQTCARRASRARRTPFPGQPNQWGGPLVQTNDGAEHRLKQSATARSPAAALLRAGWLAEVRLKSKTMPPYFNNRILLDKARHRNPRACIQVNVEERRGWTSPSTREERRGWTSPSTREERLNLTLHQRGEERLNLTLHQRGEERLNLTLHQRGEERLNLTLHQRGEERLNLTLHQRGEERLNLTLHQRGG
ncbi:unnamed protein product [Boreogadus saida]